MKNMTLQHTLTFETLDPEEVLKRDYKELAEASFQKVKCVTYEKYKLFTRMQETQSELGTRENEIFSFRKWKI